MAPAAAEYVPHSAGTPERGERVIKEGFLVEEAMQSVVKSQWKSPGCGNRREGLIGGEGPELWYEAGCEGEMKVWWPQASLSKP